MKEKVTRVSAMPRPATNADNEINPNMLDGVRLLKPFEPEGPLTACVVCNNKSVQVPNAAGEKRIVGYDAVEKTNIYAVIVETAEPGRTI